MDIHNNGKYIGFSYNGVEYYYVYNLQGDVEALADSNGTIIARYTYDPWGKIVAITDAALNDISTNASHIANINPIRYRGYYYDTETGFYYVSSRYYDPEIGRFINADTITDGGAGVLGNNLFLYAANNPMNNSDPSGHWIIKNAIKWVAKNIVNPVVKKTKSALSKINITCTKGNYFNFSIFKFIGVSVQTGCSIDTKGNVSLQGTISAGLTISSSPSISIGDYGMITNAPSVNNLNGFGGQLGAATTIPIPDTPIGVDLGLDVNVIPDIKRKTQYYGGTAYIGVTPPTAGFGVHGSIGYTGSIPININVFNIYEGLYVLLMES